MLDNLDQVLISATNMLAAINDAMASGADFSLITFIGAALIATGVVTLVAVLPLDGEDAPITVPAEEQFFSAGNPAVLPIRSDAGGSHFIPSTVAVARTFPDGGRDV